MADDLIVIGAGGFGRETLDVVEAINAAASEPVWNVLGVVDDATEGPNIGRLVARGYRHLGSVRANAPGLANTTHVLAVGSPRVRARLAREISGPVATPLIHPSAVVGSRTSLGKGVIVCAGAQLSTNVIAAAHVHLNPGATIGHDSVLGEFVSINPGAIVSGDVHIKRGTLIGAGAVIIQGLTVGEWSTVGASACVTKDVGNAAVVKGIPAR